MHNPALIDWITFVVVGSTAIMAGRRTGRDRHDEASP
ncbi:MAG: hypothetical protein JWO38_7454 [Gemmataceae bacterium]|nr:hypothetical protein [Gemmataceae bacterium]